MVMDNGMKTKMIKLNPFTLENGTTEYSMDKDCLNLTVIPHMKEDL